MEPERHIEKVLREYARERRAKAGERFDLHPATRRLLQGEAARRFGKPTPRRGFFTWLAVLGRHPAWSASVALLLLTSLGWWLLREPQVELAAKLPPPAAEPAKELALAEPPGAARKDQPPPMANAVGGQPARASTAAPALDAAGALPASRVVAQAPPAPAMVRAESVEKREFLATNQVAAAALSSDESFRLRYGLAPQTNVGTLLAQSAPAASNLAIAFERVASEAELASNKSLELAADKLQLKELPGSRSAALSDAAPSYSLRQNFARNPAPLAKSKASRRVTPAAQSVLNNFEMRQNGMEIELVDEDGSVYRGKLDTNLLANSVPASVPARNQAPAAPSVNRATGLASAPLQNQRQDMQALGIPFRVAGTNKTLRQAVVFNGLLQNQAQNQSPAALSNSNQAASALNQAGRQSQNALQNSMSNSQISGRLRVGKEPETDLLAMPKPGN